MAEGRDVLTDRTGAEHQGMQLSELSRAMVRLYKELFGRGPTKAHSVYATADLLIVTLEDTLTPAEASLARMGEHQRLRETRMFFQYSTEDEFVRVVEQVTGRRVRAFVSGIDTRHNVSAEVFYLEPDPAAPVTVR